MGNERLRSAITSAGLTNDALSTEIGVDPKTVERWISTDRIPYRTHRMAVSALLGRDDAYLWPSTETDIRSCTATRSELVAIHPNRGSLPINTWNTLLEHAQECIELMACAATFLHDLPDFNDRLAAKAEAGVTVRLLFADPTSEAVRIRGDEEAVGELLAARCRLTWTYLKPVLATSGVVARMHGCTLYNSTFRFDDSLLVNTHTFGAPASRSPLLHIERVPGGRLFTNYVSGFERTWQRSTDVATANSAA